MRIKVCGQELFAQVVPEGEWGLGIWEDEVLRGWRGRGRGGYWGGGKGGVGEGFGGRNMVGSKEPGARQRRRRKAATGFAWARHPRCAPAPAISSSSSSSSPSPPPTSISHSGQTMPSTMLLQTSSFSPRARPSQIPPILVMSCSNSSAAPASITRSVPQNTLPTLSFTVPPGPRDTVVSPPCSAHIQNLCLSTLRLASSRRKVIRPSFCFPLGPYNGHHKLCCIP